MKKIIMLMIVALFSFSLVSATTGGSLNIELEDLTPAVVEPGEDFTMQFRIYNDGEDFEENLNVELEFEDQIFLKSSENNFDETFSLCSKCSKDNQFYFNTKSDILSGEYPITVKVSNGLSTVEEVFLIKINGVPDIVINVAEISGDLIPGSEFGVNFEVKNVGSGLARNIKIIPSNDEFVLKGESLIFIEELKPSETVLLGKTVLASPELEAGPSQLELETSYKDEISQDYVSSQKIGVDLVSKAELSLVSIKTGNSVITPLEEFELNLRIENIGEGEANNVKVNILSSGFTGEKVSFVGTIDEGEDVPAIISLNSNEVGEQKLELEITYTDDLGEHSIKEEYFIETKAPGNPLIVVLIGLSIVGVLGYMFFRRKKSQK